MVPPVRERACCPVGGYGGPVPQLLSVRQAAEALGTTPRSVRRWIQAGKLAAVRLPGGQWRVSTGALRDALQSSPGSSLTITTSDRSKYW